MKHNGKWHERHWNRIRDEFGEEPREVVRVMHHEQHVPLCHIAEILCVCENTLRDWCKSWGLPTMRDGYKPMKPRCKVERRAKELGYPDVQSAIVSLRQSGKQWNEVKEILRCADSTISRYLAEAARGYYNLSESGRRIKSETRKRLNAEGRRGTMPSLRFVVPLGASEW